MFERCRCSKHVHCKQLSLDWAMATVALSLTVSVLVCFYAGLQDDMRCAEDYVRFCCKYILEHCMPDLQFINKMIDSTAIARLQQVCRCGCGVGIGWRGLCWFCPGEVMRRCLDCCCQWACGRASAA